MNCTYFRTISFNASIFVLFKTKRGHKQVELLGRQIFGKSRLKQFLEAYRNSTAKPYGYLVIDLEIHQDFPLRSNIFPDDEEEFVYVLE